MEHVRNPFESFGNGPEMQKDLQDIAAALEQAWQVSKEERITRAYDLPWSMSRAES